MTYTTTVEIFTTEAGHKCLLFLSQVLFTCLKLRIVLAMDTCTLLCHNLSIGFLTGIQSHNMAYAPDLQGKHRHNRVQEELSSLHDVLTAIEDESEDEYVNPLPPPRTSPEGYSG